jgi:hypothetical protein
MTRETAKHGPRRDDELAREEESLLRGAPLESHTQEFKEKEGPFAEELGLPADPVLARREFSRHLDSRIFPAGRQSLIENARENQAPDQIVAVLAALPTDAEFATVYELWEALERLERTHDLGVDESASAIEFEERAEGREPRSIR